MPLPDSRRPWIVSPSLSLSLPLSLSLSFSLLLSLALSRPQVLKRFLQTIVPSDEWKTKPIDWLLDRFRTATNTFGDSVGSAVVDRTFPDAEAA